MSNSLFIEQQNYYLAFYINGELQFHSQDEAIYHEYLVIPAIKLAISRFPNTDLRVLICGGGDGLAARDILRFPQVKQIDLVDYDPEVLELAKTVFKPYNQGSLEKEKITIYTQEAFGFISQLPENHYHVVISDFTYPNTAEETAIYSREWFQEINRVLIPGGLTSINAVSPNYNTEGFWCLYQTLISADLFTKPLQVDIPSCHDHGYGKWGFLLASSQVIQREEIEEISLPDNLQYLTQKNLIQSFIFTEEIAENRYNCMVNTIENKQLFYYLLNRVNNSDIELNSEEKEIVNFLDINEETSTEIGNINALDLETVAKFWLENIYTQPDAENPPVDINQYIPVRHRYHSPKMTTSWLTHIQDLLLEIDCQRLLKSILQRTQELPPQIANELKNLSEKINSNQPLSNLSPKTFQFITLLSVTLLMANLVSPDSVFAKGYYSRSSSSSNSSPSNDDYYSFLNVNKILGFVITIMAGSALIGILSRSKNE